MSNEYQLYQAIQQALATANGAAAMARQAAQAAQAAASIKNEISAQIRNAVNEAMSRNVPGARADMRYVDSIPGKRVPFDMVVSQAVGADDVGPWDVPMQISADGYFVATHRYATFLSSFSFQVAGEGGDVATFAGRSSGRYRPVHSALDLMDGQGGWNPAVGAANPGTGIWQVEHVTNRSGFRTMEWDGTIEMRATDSDYRRQNNPVPSSMWASGFNALLKLSVPDVFKPATTIMFHVQSNHINNPAAGNIAAVVGSLPYIDGQYDGHEGIGYPAAVPAETPDTKTRRPDGILVLGYMGHMILAPGATTA
jgi:hypothetical protein